MWGLLCAIVWEKDSSWVEVTPQGEMSWFLFGVKSRPLYHIYATINRVSSLSPLFGLVMEPPHNSKGLVYLLVVIVSMSAPFGEQEMGDMNVECSSRPRHFQSDRPRARQRVPHCNSGAARCSSLSFDSLRYIINTWSCPRAMIHFLGRQCRLSKSIKLEILNSCRPPLI